MNWGCIVPHSRFQMGAKRFDNKLTEYEYGLQMAPYLMLPWDTRDNGGINDAAKRLKKFYNVDALIEPHFNAFNGKVSGAEILVIDEVSYAHAKKILEHWGKNEVRGVKLISSGARGYTNLFLMKKHVEVAILTELFFGDNPLDYVEPIEQALFLRDHLKWRGGPSLDHLKSPAYKRHDL